MSQARINAKRRQRAKDAVANIGTAIEDLKEKASTFFIFVPDSKGIPNGSLSYLYHMGKAIKDAGYEVSMLYQVADEYTEEEVRTLKENGSPIDDARVFTGVGGWMGEEYASLPHINIQKEQAWVVGPADFLLIPEAFSSMMFQTNKKNVACKRYVVLQNKEYAVDSLPMGSQWANAGIDHVIASTQALADYVNKVFPYTKEHTRVLPPCVEPLFSKGDKPQQLGVNIISRRPADIAMIIKPFQWLYPQYSFVPFRELRTLPKKEFAKALQEWAITIWIDEKTNFGYSALEAMACGDVVIGKTPDHVPEWMERDNGLWFNDIDDLPEILYEVVASWMTDNIPEEFRESAAKTMERYSKTSFEDNVKGMCESMVDERIAELVEVEKARAETLEERENKKKKEEE